MTVLFKVNHLITISTLTYHSPFHRRAPFEQPCYRIKEYEVQSASFWPEIGSLGRVGGIGGFSRWKEDEEVVGSFKMSQTHPTAGWERVGDRFYRKTQLYTAVFDLDLDLDSFFVAGAPYGGAVGVC